MDIFKSLTPSSSKDWHPSIMISDIQKKIYLAIKYPKATYRYIVNIVTPKKTDPFPGCVNLFVTSSCNLNCPMCGYANYMHKVVPRESMHLEEVKKILPELKKYKPLVYLQGGEPLVNPDTLPIIKLLSRNCIFTGMTSNGFLLEKFSRELAKSGLEFLSLSLDNYVKEKHDVGRGVAGTYDHLLSGLKALQIQRKIYGKPINVKINTVLRKDNFSKLSEMYDFIESLGIDEWQISNLCYITPEADKNIKKFREKTGLKENWAGNRINSDKYFTDNQVKILQNQLQIIKDKSKHYKTKLLLGSVSDLKKYYQGKPPSKESSCSTPFRAVTINAGGIMKVSCMDIEIGNLQQDSIYSIWHSPKNTGFQKLITKMKVLPPCFRCCSLSFKW